MGFFRFSSFILDQKWNSYICSTKKNPHKWKQTNTKKPKKNSYKNKQEKAPKTATSFVGLQIFSTYLFLTYI